MSSYRDLVEALRESCPTLGANRRLAHEERCRLVANAGTPRSQLEAIEELLAYLVRLDGLLVVESETTGVQIGPLRFLIQRAIGDFETATEATLLSGFSTASRSSPCATSWR